ncbi:hypothetical protein [Mandarin fish ranavirus]|nr:hypothetical protein [Mandarin fish ranavirus]
MVLFLCVATKIRSNSSIFTSGAYCSHCSTAAVGNTNSSLSLTKASKSRYCPFQNGSVMSLKVLGLVGFHARNLGELPEARILVHSRNEIPTGTSTVLPFTSTFIVIFFSRSGKKLRLKNQIFI